MEGDKETAPKLSNGTSLNDVCVLFHGHDNATSAWNNSKMVQHSAILTMADQ